MQGYISNPSLSGVFQNTGHKNWCSMSSKISEAVVLYRLKCLVQHYCYYNITLVTLGRPRAGWGHQISLHDSTPDFPKIQVLVNYVSKNLTDIPQTSVSLQPLTLTLVVGGVMARLGPLIKPSSTSRRREVTVDPNKFNLSKSSLHSSWHAIQGDQKRLWIVISLWQTWKLRKMAKLCHFVKWHIMRFWYFDASEKVGEKILTF